MEIELYTKQFIELRHQSDKINEEQRPLVTRTEEVHRQLLTMSEEATRFRVRLMIVLLILLFQT